MTHARSVRVKKRHASWAVRARKVFSGTETLDRPERQPTGQLEGSNGPPSVPQWQALPLDRAN